MATLRATNHAALFGTLLTIKHLPGSTEVNLCLLKHSTQKLGQVSGITSIPEVERSIDSSTSVVYRPLAIQILAARAPMLILRYRDSLNNATRENPSNSNLRHLSTVVIFEL